MCVYSWEHVPVPASVWGTQGGDRVLSVLKASQCLSVSGHVVHVTSTGGVSRL